MKIAFLSGAVVGIAAGAMIPRLLSTHWFHDLNLHRVLAFVPIQLPQGFQSMIRILVKELCAEAGSRIAGQLNALTIS